MGNVPFEVSLILLALCSLITIPIFLFGVNFCRYFFGMFDFLSFNQVLLYCVGLGLFVAGLAAWHIELGIRGR